VPPQPKDRCQCKLKFTPSFCALPKPKMEAQASVNAVHFALGYVRKLVHTTDSLHPTTDSVTTEQPARKGGQPL